MGPAYPGTMFEIFAVNDAAADPAELVAVHETVGGPLSGMVFGAA